MGFLQITIFPISNRRDGETILAGINARVFSLIFSEHKLKCVLKMLTYCCQCLAGFLEICMHTWKLFPLLVIFRRMLIFNGKSLVLVPKDTYNQLYAWLQVLAGIDMAQKCFMRFYFHELPCYGEQQKNKNGKLFAPNHSYIQTARKDKSQKTGMHHAL